MTTSTQATHEQITNHTLNSISLLNTLQVTGEDLNEGFLIGHQDVINLLDIVKENLEQINSLNKLSSTPF